MGADAAAFGLLSGATCFRSSHASSNPWACPEQSRGWGARSRSAIELLDKALATQPGTVGWMSTLDAGEAENAVDYYIAALPGPSSDRGNRWT